MTITAADLIGSIPFALAALSFALREIFYLRIVSIIASIGMILVALNIHDHWHAIVFWNLVFIGIHGAQLAITVYGERAARFTEREQELYETLFRDMTKLEFLKLMRAGEWRDAAPEAVLAVEGEPIDELLLIANGVARVDVEHHEVAELRDGSFIGEMSYMTHEPASATVTVTEPTQYVAWPKRSLRDLLRRNPTMKFAMTQIFGAEVSRKLRRAGHHDDHHDEPQNP